MALAHGALRGPRQWGEHGDPALSRITVVDARSRASSSRAHAPRQDARSQRRSRSARRGPWPLAELPARSRSSRRHAEITLGTDWLAVGDGGAIPSEQLARRRSVRAPPEIRRFTAQRERRSAS